MILLMFAFVSSWLGSSRLIPDWLGVYGPSDTTWIYPTYIKTDSIIGTIQVNNVSGDTAKYNVYFPNDYSYIVMKNPLEIKLSGGDSIYMHNKGTRNVAIGIEALDSVYLGAANEPDNVAIGYQALKINSNFSVLGGYNVAIGSYAGDSAKGQSNTFIGYKAGWKSSDNGNNIFIGVNAGANATVQSGNRWNVAIGNLALEHIPGDYNVAIGNAAGRNVSSNSYVGENVMIGANAGYSIGSIRNVIIGSNAGYSLGNGGHNVLIGGYAGYNLNPLYTVFIGENAGYNATGGDSSVVIGNGAGYNATGRKNVFLGCGAGYNEAGSNKLYIANDSTSSPLIYGEFDNKLFAIGGSLQLRTGDSATAYMKSDTLKLNPVKGSGYFDLRLWTLLLKDGDYYFGSILPADSISRIGKSDSAFATGYYKYLHADSLRTTDNAFLGDSGKTTTIGKGGEVIVPSASLVETTRYEANAIKYNISTGAFYVWIGSAWSIMVGTNVTFRSSIYPYTNNTSNIGTSSHRFHDLQIAGSIVDSTGMISGSGTFPATYTCDTFLLSGVVSTDVIQAGWKGATIPNKPLTSVAGTDTIFIYCDVSDTTKARAEGFTYMRTAHKP